MDTTQPAPKKEWLALRREIRSFVADLVRGVFQQDGINEALLERGWDIDDPATGERISRELWRIINDLESVRK